MIGDIETAMILEREQFLLDAPNLWGQVYIEARVYRDWPSDAAVEAASNAEALCGNEACKTMSELASVTDEVLRVD